MQWFASNPHAPNPGIHGTMKWGAHKFGRSAFPSAFARGGGYVSSAFAPTTKEALTAPWRKKHKVGSMEHIHNLRRMQAEKPNSKAIQRAITKAETSASKFGAGKLAASIGMGAAMVALPAFMTPGSGLEKARAAAGGVASIAGWEIGMRAGMGGGAALGNFILPGVGGLIGGGVGAIAGGLAGAIGADAGFQALSRIPDRMVERERARRNLNWRGDTTAFMTQSAHTMRQQSLQAMNRGQQSARSMLGREGVMLHQ